MDCVLQYVCLSVILLCQLESEATHANQQSSSKQSSSKLRAAAIPFVPSAQSSSQPTSSDAQDKRDATNAPRDVEPAAVKASTTTNLSTRPKRKTLSRQLKAPHETKDGSSNSDDGPSVSTKPHQSQNSDERDDILVQANAVSNVVSVSSASAAKDMETKREPVSWKSAAAVVLASAGAAVVPGQAFARPKQLTSSATNAPLPPPPGLGFSPRSSHHSMSATVTAPGIIQVPVTSAEDALAAAELESVVRAEVTEASEHVWAKAEAWIEAEVSMF